VLTLKIVADLLGLASSPSWQDVSLNKVEFDSRQVVPGDLFVCIPGFKSDGHDYAEQVVGQGARALVVERFLETLKEIPQLVVPKSRRALAEIAAFFHGYPAKAMRTVGITGTNGKTSTAHFCEAVLKGSGRVPGVLGTIETKIAGRPIPASHTTPESLVLQGLFAQMREAGCDSVVMEVSSHALDLDRVHGVPFDVAVFTNLSHDHLDFHGDMDSYFAAKRKLFTNLRYYKGRPAPYAVINGDDDYGMRLIEGLKVPYITYGCGEHCHVRATNLSIAPSGVSFDLETPIGGRRVDLAMSGLFTVYNALAAVGTGLANKVDLEEILLSIESVASVAGRFEQIREGQEFAVVVDYAHTPDGLEKLLHSAREITQKRLFVVFGCGGDRDPHKRPVMGEIAGRLADNVLLTSDNPRSESPVRILDQIQGGMMASRAHIEVEPDRAQAIFRAIALAEAGDTVVIAGKGHETYQIIGDRTLEFDDREVARHALRGRMFRGKGQFRTQQSNLTWTERRRSAAPESAVVSAGEP
jgi:UDP-N-acetylmuramoyl-L-alanyl-D-glutamate--2,6-diaminopimelate ligase